ncbi:cytochrome-c peroxidase [Pirellulaceae bacterium SH467]
MSERWSVKRNCPSTVRRATEETVLDLLSRSDEYQVLFQQSFGDGGITIERVAEAIACFERTIVGGSSRFDAFIKGKREVFQDSEMIGLDLYRREARCMNCHHGPLFSDGRFKESQRSDERFPRKSAHLKPLGLNKQDLEDLAAFLRTLEEPKRRMTAPPLPELHIFESP